MIFVHILILLLYSRVAPVVCTSENKCEVEYRKSAGKIKFICPISSNIEVMVDKGFTCSFTIRKERDVYNRVAPSNVGCTPDYTATIEQGNSIIKASRWNLSKKRNVEFAQLLTIE